MNHKFLLVGIVLLVFITNCSHCAQKNGTVKWDPVKDNIDYTFNKYRIEDFLFDVFPNTMNRTIDAALDNLLVNKYKFQEFVQKTFFIQLEQNMKNTIDYGIQDKKVNQIMDVILVNTPKITAEIQSMNDRLISQIDKLSSQAFALMTTLGIGFIAIHLILFIKSFYTPSASVTTAKALQSFTLNSSTEEEYHHQQQQVLQQNQSSSFELTFLCFSLFLCLVNIAWITILSLSLYQSLYGNIITIHISICIIVLSLTAVLWYSLYFLIQLCKRNGTLIVESYFNMLFSMLLLIATCVTSGFVLIKVV